MVFDHQAHMVNLLTRLGWEARMTQHETAALSMTATHRVDQAARDVFDYLLFTDEAPLPSALRGSSGFSETFSALGPKDHKGRSLRQLDLDHRLMRYPCSFVIYAPAFDALPASALDKVYRGLWDALSGRDSSRNYPSLSVADRTAIAEIPRDTKKICRPIFRGAIR